MKYPALQKVLAAAKEWELWHYISEPGENPKWKKIDSFETREDAETAAYQLGVDKIPKIFQKGKGPLEA